MQRRSRTKPLPALRLVPRTRFQTEVWQYKTGQHVSFIGPTGAGKTHLALPLLARSVNEERKGFVTVMKPRDKTVGQFMVRHHWKRILNYPPPPSAAKVVGEAPPGYIVWPNHTTNPELDEVRHEAIFRKMHRDLYVKGDAIIFDDEAVSLVREMDLKPDLVRIWTKGRSVGCGLWAATQRPSLVPLEMYDQAEHLFLAYDPDERNQKRFGEIGGVNPDLVTHVVARLPRFHWLYIRRSDRTMCVVGP
jgi:energy-coupling factor transporter ATP-binding protein EcfA2